MSASYPASPIKRVRSTRAQVNQRRCDLLAIVQAMQPIGVRGAFYQAEVRGVVNKTERDYDKVQTDLTLMRRSGALPYGWIVDNSRWQRKPRTFGSVRDALEETARSYRKALWADAGAHVEIWIEKDGLAGVVLPVAALYDVPLMATRGYSSLSFLYEAAQYIGSLDVPSFIYHLGDFDPSGVNAGEKIEQTLREMAPTSEIHFERLAVNLDQIREWDLPTRPTKQSDSRSQRFGAISVELDAIAPYLLRAIVRSAIERHLPTHKLKILQIAEAEERKLLRGLVGLMEARL